MANDVLLFNPAVASTEELRTVFVARHKLLETLAAELREQHASPTIQHYLIVGPRGIGKTHLTEILARQLAADETHPWRTVRMPEESYSYRGLDELLAAIVERDTDTERAWDAPVPSIEVSLDTLAARQQDTGQPLLVMLENLPRVLQRTLRGKQEISRLRAILMCSPPFTLMTTATSYFEDIAREDRPLYDFFRVIPLRDLTGDEIEEMVRRRAAWDELAPAQIELSVRRARAISHLSGGNPRLVLALYSVIRAGVTQDIQRQFLGLLDRVTVYYQARLDDLSQQQATVLTRLALAPGPVAAAKLARLSALPTSHTTAVLNVLLAERLVRRVPGPGKRRHVYEVNDRLFRIWLEMRESRGARRRLRFLIDFYRMAYSPDELKSLLDRWRAFLGEQVKRGMIERFADHLLTIDYISDALNLDGSERATAILLELRSPEDGALDREGLRKAIERSRTEHPEAAAALHVTLAVELMDDRLHDGYDELLKASKLTPSWTYLRGLICLVQLYLGLFQEACDTSRELSDDSSWFPLCASARFLSGAEDDDAELRRALQDTTEKGMVFWRSLVRHLPVKVETSEREYRFVELVLERDPGNVAMFATAMLLADAGQMWDDFVDYAEEWVRLEPEGELGWLALAHAAANLGEVDRYVTALSRLKSLEDPLFRRGPLRALAVALLNAASLQGPDEQEEYRARIMPMFEGRELAVEDLDELYGGLWNTCDSVTIEWTARVVALFAELTGIAPEPWQSFREYVESGQKPEFLRTLHPEVREAVALLLARHGAERDGPDTTS